MEAERRRSRENKLEIFTTMPMASVICHRLMNAHHARLSRHAALFGWPTPDIQGLQRRLEDKWENRDQPQLCRISVNDAGTTIQFRSFLAPPSRGQAFGRKSIRIILTPTQVHPFFGIVKTNQREPYERALQMAKNVGADEALLVDSAGNIVDGTRSSPIAVDREDPDHLIVPIGGLQGITREIYGQSRKKQGCRISRRYISSSYFNKYDWIMCGSGMGVVSASCL